MRPMRSIMSSTVSSDFAKSNRNCFYLNDAEFRTLRRQEKLNAKRNCQRIARKCTGLDMVCHPEFNTR